MNKVYITNSQDKIEVTRNYNITERMFLARVGDIVVLDIVRDGVAMSISITVTESSITNIE